ncbi:ABC transporter permease [Priestia megaterium]|uniref:ABC transporter permease n=1 Tax=Priestia megaterium TaxID=1404 RepID=UPI003390FE1E
MSKIDALWKQRFQQYLVDIRRYTKYILNDHIKLVLIFAIGGLAYYYQQWLSTLTPAFPSAVVIAILMGLILTTGQIQTFLKRPDLVFLLPLETKLQPYFKKSFWFTFTIQLYILLFATGAAAPLQVKVMHDSYSNVFVFFLLLLILKVVNLGMSWWAVWFEEKWAKWTDYIVRFFLNAVFTYFLFSHAYAFFTGIVAVIMIALAIYYRSLTKRKPIKWEKLIDLEEKRMGYFYRLANLFTDVPQVKERIKRRRYLDWLVARIPFRQSATYHYLYTRTFLRSGDYLSLLVRLTVIGGFLIVAAPFQYGNIVVVLFVVYMTGFQLLPLWKQHKQILWLSLYPVEAKERKKAFLDVWKKALYVQILVLAIAVAFSNLVAALLSMAAGAIFIHLFIHAYVNKKLT